LAACEHKAVTGVRRDAVCTLYQGVRYFQNGLPFANIRKIRNVQQNYVHIILLNCIQIEQWMWKRITIHYAPT
jgi:hypothetical protein